jgi:four helix bundle protein
MGRHVAGQLIRSGTSPAPNYEEARAAESPADFRHKMSLCLKELRESRCWLQLIGRSGLMAEPRIAAPLDEATQLCRIFANSIVTSKGLAARNDGTETAADDTQR